MKEFKYVIKDVQGIHARPAGELVKLAKTFQCKIELKKGEQTADCKRIFSIMSLGIKYENEVVFTFEGEDEDAAYEAFRSFVSQNM